MKGFFHHESILNQELSSSSPVNSHMEKERFMTKKYFAGALLLALFMFPAAMSGYPMPALSQKTIEEKFETAQKEFSKRWKHFAKGRKFSVFPRSTSDENIMSEFDDLQAIRHTVYYENPHQHPLRSTQDFERSQELLMFGFYKAPNLAAFHYNMSHPSYNSSNVSLNGHHFLALEGPQKPEHVPHFKRLLVNYGVKKILRLTKDVESGVFKSENYWKGHLAEDPQGQQVLTYELPEETKPEPYTFPYYGLDTWADNTGIDPSILLDLIERVRKEYKPGDLTAVHCSAGVGRTGTFIAGFLILEDIDSQLKRGVPLDQIQLSIEELVYKLTLQRAYLVGNKAQYLTLYKLAGEYLDRLQRKEREKIHPAS